MADARVMDSQQRASLVRRGQKLSIATILYNAVEGILAVVAGALAGSISLVGFGVDSVIEVASGGAALWRLHADVEPERRARVETTAHRLIGASFLALAAYIAYDAVDSLRHRQAAAESYLGIAIAIGSLIVMPLLARAKRRVASGLHSRALAADATQTDLCTYLSVILLGGLLLNATLGWWWADSVAALAMTPFIAGEGIAGLKGEPPCGDECA
jgi:divalent metal cation (Fe/Co/Zn/Cd) transporter